MNISPKTTVAVCALALLAATPGGAQMNAKDVKTPAAPPAPSAALLAPEKAVEQAPKTFKARFITTKGDIVITIQRDWAPRGADRFYNLVKAGYFNETAFFRAVDGFMVQFGINGDPKVNAKWRAAAIQDDPASGHSNSRGMITFAMAGPNSRTTQVFINFGDNGRLDSMGFTPFGQVTEGMNVLDSLYKGYGDGAPYGMGPDQGRIQAEGNAYLKKDFSKLDWIKSAHVEG